MFQKINNYFSYNKEKYENIIDDPKSKAWVFFDRLIIALVFLFLLILMIESIWTFWTDYMKELYILDAIISIIFAVEYFYRFLRSKHKINFFFKPIRIIDLLSFLPFLLWFVTAWKYLWVLKILRSLRVLRLVKRLPLTSGFIKSLKLYLDEYKAVFTLYLVVLFLGSFFVYFVEKDINWDMFKNIPEALRWGLVTTTTVWYWDIYPITPIWKTIWSILLFVWPLLGWLVSAVTVMVFMESSANIDKQRNRRWKMCYKCKTRNPKEANYCMKCGQDLLVKQESL